MKKQGEENNKYVLDTSAFLTFFEDEEGADTVQAVLESARDGKVKIFASFVSFMEVFYITFREEGEDEAIKRISLMNSLSVGRVESFPELGLIAGKLKANHRISFADAWVAATAVFYEALLVHKDPEFESLKNAVSLLTLPYKQTTVLNN